MPKQFLKKIKQKFYDKGYSDGWMEAERNFQENMRQRDFVEQKAEFNKARFLMEDYRENCGKDRNIL